MSGPDRITGAVPGTEVRGELVRDMFSRIAPTYDLANRVLSLGVDKVWRRRALAALGDAARGDVLDLCAGTLDLTLALTGHARSVTAVDFAAPMLAVGRARLPARSTTEVTVLVGDAMALDLPDRAFDGGVCGFGLRNVADLPRTLAEVHRVLRPGGVFVVLEFFRPTTALARLFHVGFNRVVLPVVGGLISGDAGAYRYLARSMEAWVDRAEFATLAGQAGLEVVRSRSLFPPVAGLVVLRRRT